MLQLTTQDRDSELDWTHAFDFIGILPGIEPKAKCLIKNHHRSRLLRSNCPAARKRLSGVSIPFPLESATVVEPITSTPKNPTR